MADEMRPAPSPSVDLWRPDGPAARAAAAIMANAVASFNEALVPALRGVRREARGEGALQEARPEMEARPDSRAQEVPPQRGDAQARGEVQVMATEYVLDAEKIAHWRIDNHVPLKQLARAAGVNLSSLGHAIRDGREVKINLLLNLAEAMGEDPRDIVRPKDRANEKAEGR